MINDHWSSLNHLELEWSSEHSELPWEQRCFPDHYDHCDQDCDHVMIIITMIIWSLRLLVIIDISYGDHDLWQRMPKSQTYQEWSHANKIKHRLSKVVLQTGVPEIVHNHLMCHRIRIFPVPSVALGKKFGFEFLANMIDLIDEYHAHSFVKPNFT